MSITITLEATHSQLLAEIKEDVGAEAFGKFDELDLAYELEQAVLVCFENAVSDELTTEEVLEIVDPDGDEINAHLEDSYFRSEDQWLDAQDEFANLVRHEVGLGDFSVSENGVIVCECVKVA